MIEVKFTKGPWGIEKHEPSCIRMGGQSLSRVAPDYAGKEEAEANARLISAAPEMYDALNKAVNMCGCTVQTIGLMCALCHDICKLLNRIDGAKS